MHVHDENGVVVVALAADQALGLWKAIEPLIDMGRRSVVVDLAGVAFLNSLNIAAVIATRNRVAALGGRFALANLSERVKSIMRVLRLDRLFDLDHTLEAAINGVR